MAPNATVGVEPGVSSRASGLIRHLIQFSLACLILPNLPFWILGTFLDIGSRGLFNLEYLGWACVALFLPSRFVVIGLSISFLLEVFLALAPIYYLSESDVVSASKFVLVLPWQRIWTIGFLLLLASMAGAFAITKLLPDRQKTYRARTAAILVSGMLILAVVDLCSGTNTFFQFSDHRSPMNIATSPGLRFAKSAYHLLRARDLRAIDRRVESATRAVKFQRTTGSLRKPNYVLILVESYGLALDRTRSEILKSPFFTPGLAQRYQVEFGTTRFEGATVSAEMRELCGVSSGVRVFPADPRLAHCLPAAMKARGYHTLAIHGFNSYLFNRRDWYPMLGFDEMHFLQDLGHSSDLPHCSGPFPGICDDAIADYIGEYLVTHRNQPQFVYWLTLNSHLPIEHVQANDAALRCGSKEAPARDADVCGLMALLYRTNLAIAKAAARSDLPPTEFLLVGDHAPPFLSNWRRALFSQREVPYVHLKPRQEPARAHPLHIITATR